MSDNVERRGTNPGAWFTVWLVMRRELRVQLRSKAFYITTGAALALLVVLSVVMTFLNSDDDDVRPVGVVSASSAAVSPETAEPAAATNVSAPTVAAMTSAVAESLEVKLDAVPIANETVGRQKVANGEIDALLVVGVPQPGVVPLRLVTNGEPDTSVQNVSAVVASRLAFDQQVRVLGGDPNAVNHAAAAAHVDEEQLEPPKDYDDGELAFGVVAGILIYMSLLLNGQTVAQGVVEEKASRVVELLLATIRPWQLMAGKVAGIGVVGLLQLAVIAGGGVIAALITNVVDISLPAAVGSLVWLVVWYLLGFFAYALALAASAALVSRQEDVGSVVMPLMMLLVVGYVIGITALPADPGNQFCAVLSMVPAFAPTLMPMRLAMGSAPVWQVALSVVLMALTIPALVALSGRIYRNAVVRTGARVSLRDAWRRAS